jgi:hypothetical protein
VRAGRTTVGQWHGIWGAQRRHSRAAGSRADIRRAGAPLLLETNGRRQGLEVGAAGRNRSQGGANQAGAVGPSSLNQCPWYPAGPRRRFVCSRGKATWVAARAQKRARWPAPARGRAGPPPEAGRAAASRGCARDQTFV